jgi:Fe2+ or Zn2+ uptake regulation protein
MSKSTNDPIVPKNKIPNNCFICAKDGADFYQGAINILKATGHRITKPREALLRVLDNLNEPRNPTDIFSIITATRPGDKPLNIDKVTIYRILQTFESLGIIHQTRQNEYFKCSIEQTTCRYNYEQEDDVKHHHKQHYHLIIKCKECGQTLIKHPEAELTFLLQTILRNYNFALSSGTIEISGLCAQCSPECSPECSAKNP